MIYKAGQNIGEGKENLGDINLFYQALIVDYRACGNQHCLLNHQPGRKTRKEKNHIVIHLELDDSGKNDGQDQKKKKRVKNCPQKTQDRVPVAQFKLCPHQIP